MEASTPEEPTKEAATPGVAAIEASTPEEPTKEASTPGVAAIEASTPEEPTKEASTPGVAAMEASTPEEPTKEASTPGVAAMEAAAETTSGAAVLGVGKTAATTSAEEAVVAAWIVDASVALKWFLPADREPDGELARAAIGKLAMRTTALAVHEVGNILTRHSGWTAHQVAAALRLLLEICGDPVELAPEDHHPAAQLALEHDLTFYDASYIAIARRTRRRLLSADGDLLTPRLALPLHDALA
ncbi:MAG TPA: PIN domain-containing protein [Solirubrobacteraceae bacterium]|nr:PIN domain-containing protein [Solirubrobacteraceae bacterium]